MVTTGIGFSAPDVDCARPLRIAVVLDRDAVSAWVQELLSSLNAAPWADLHVVDADEAGSPTSRPSGGFAYRLMEALDRRLIGHPSLDDAERLVEIGSVRRRRSSAHPDCIDVVVDVRSGPSCPVGTRRRGRNVWSIEFGTPAGPPVGTVALLGMVRPASGRRGQRRAGGGGHRSTDARRVVHRGDARSVAHREPEPCVLARRRSRPPRARPPCHLAFGRARQRGHARAPTVRPAVLAAGSRGGAVHRGSPAPPLRSTRRARAPARAVDSRRAPARGRSSSRRAQRLRGDHPASRPGVRRPLRRVRRGAPIPLHRGIRLRATKATSR